MGGVSQGSDIEWVLRMSRSLPAKNAGMGISGEDMEFRDLRELGEFHLYLTS